MIAGAYKLWLRLRGYRVTGPWRTSVGSETYYRCTVGEGNEREVATSRGRLKALREARRMLRRGL